MKPIGTTHPWLVNCHFVRNCRKIKGSTLSCQDISIHFCWSDHCKLFRRWAIYSWVKGLTTSPGAAGAEGWWEREDRETLELLTGSTVDGWTTSYLALSQKGCTATCWPKTVIGVKRTFLIKVITSLRHPSTKNTLINKCYHTSKADTCVTVAAGVWNRSGGSMFGLQLQHLW